MLKRLTNIFNYNSNFSEEQECQHARLVYDETKIFGVTLAVLLTGQAIQYFPEDVPRIMRYYLTNTVDPIVFASAFNGASMGILKSRTQGLILALGFAAGGIWHENVVYDRALESDPDNAQFDFIDSAIYISSALTYGLWNQSRYKKKIYGLEDKNEPVHQ